MITARVSILPPRFAALSSHASIGGRSLLGATGGGHQVEELWQVPVLVPANRRQRFASTRRSFGEGCDAARGQWFHARGRLPLSDYCRWLCTSSAGPCHDFDRWTDFGPCPAVDVVVGSLTTLNRRSGYRSRSTRDSHVLVATRRRWTSLTTDARTLDRVAHGGNAAGEGIDDSRDDAPPRRLWSRTRSSRRRVATRTLRGRASSLGASSIPSEPTGSHGHPGSPQRLDSPRSGCSAVL